MRLNPRRDNPGTGMVVTYGCYLFIVLRDCLPGLSLLGSKRIRGFLSILRYINPIIIISGTVPVHARVPVHAHPRFSQRFIPFEAYYEHQSTWNNIIDHPH